MNFDFVIADFEDSKDVKRTGFSRASEVLQSLRDWVELPGNLWQAADVYSISMTCYEILTRKAPFHRHQWSNYKVVLDGNRPELPFYVGEGLNNILQRCWDHVPTNRPSFAEILLLLREIENYAQLITSELERVEEIIQWVSSLRTPEAMFWELVRLAGTFTRALENDSQRCRDNSKWASEFILIVEQFVSIFGWDSFSKHPSLPFARHVERRRFLTLIAVQLEGYAPMEGISTEMTGDYKALELMRNVYNSISQGYWQSEYHPEDDEDLILHEKLATVERALVEPLLHAKVCKVQIMAVAVMAFKDLLRANFRGYLEINAYWDHLQSRLDLSPEQHSKDLQHTLNEHGLALLSDSWYVSSIVSTSVRLVMAYNGRLVADLSCAGF